MSKHKIAAFKESVADTAVGAIINLPMNFILLAIGLHWGLDALWLSIFMTGVFTIIAVIRKYLIRLHFMSRNTDSDASLATEQYEEAMRKFQYR